jgi:hypothetical protein
MTSNRWSIAALAALLLIVVANRDSSDTAARAQRPELRPSRAERFQISAYAGQAEHGVAHGCYIVDTFTGRVWHTRLGGTPERVSDSLRGVTNDEQP